MAWIKEPTFWFTKIVICTLKTSTAYVHFRSAYQNIHVYRKVSIAWKLYEFRVFSGSVFYRIRTEYRDLLCKSLYSRRIQKNTDQKKTRICALFMQWLNQRKTIWQSRLGQDNLWFVHGGRHRRLRYYCYKFWCCSKVTSPLASAGNIFKEENMFEKRTSMIFD